jgi:hypothetical protein
VRKEMDEIALEVEKFENAYIGSASVRGYVNQALECESKQLTAAANHYWRLANRMAYQYNERMEEK